MAQRPGTVPLAGLVVVAAFLAGYFSPDVFGVASADPPVSAGAPTQAVAGPIAPATPAPATDTPAATPTATGAPAAAGTPPALTPAPSPSQPPLSPSPTPTPRVHVVASGDNLSSIAKRYGVTPEAIVRANSIASPDRLAVGQKLVIPE